MDTRTAVLVTIVAERLLRDRLVDKIRALGGTGFTLTDVQGEGTRAIHVHDFEGANVKIETLVTTDVAEKIVEAVSKYFEHHAVIVYMSDVKVVRGKKFTG